MHKLRCDLALTVPHYPLHFLASLNAAGYFLNLSARKLEFQCGHLQHSSCINNCSHSTGNMYVTMTQAIACVISPCTVVAMPSMAQVKETCEDMEQRLLKYFPLFHYSNPDSPSDNVIRKFVGWIILSPLIAI